VINCPYCRREIVPGTMVCPHCDANLRMTRAELTPKPKWIRIAYPVFGWGLIALGGLSLMVGFLLPRMTFDLGGLVMIGAGICWLRRIEKVLGVLKWIILADMLIVPFYIFTISQFFSGLTEDSSLPVIGAVLAGLRLLFDLGALIVLHKDQNG
jgi:hypothetical protein